jgi:hypothetical protein
MFRLWAKVFHENRLIKDMVVCNNKNDTRTRKVFDGIDEVCYAFDLGKPMWLDSSVASFKKHSKVRFSKDNFIESIDFDFLEIHVIEED